MTRLRVVVCAVVGCLTLGLCLAGAAGAVASGWGVQPVPAPVVPNGQLSALSCASTTACTAVGSFRDGPNSQVGVMLAEGWNGASWSIQRTPHPAGATGSVLNGVSCTSATACTAVGFFVNSVGTDVTLVERWNGASWSVQSTPNLAGGGGILNGVSCTSTTACTAVGFASTGAGEVTLAERWNGVSWSIQRIPNPVGGLSRLSGVSCTSATACIAVGFFGGPRLPLAERWNGASWSVQSTPSPADSTDTALNGVSCTSTTACTAVGFAFTSAGEVTLAERWNGASWSVQSTPNPAGATGSSLNGVSCASTTACTAIGYSLLTERWNGTSWSIQRTPGVTGGQVTDVSCASTTTCTAVGSFVNRADAQVTLAERWNGASWSIQTTPNPAGATDSGFSGNSCASTTECTAVGSLFTGTGTTTMLAERWNGVSWSIQRTPNPAGARGSGFYGVSCPATTACTAVGFFVSSAGEVPLVERWNGAIWSIQRTPNPAGAAGSQFNGVSCTSTTACTAVGLSENSVTKVPLVERWNGAGWSIQRTPAGATGGQFDAVSCTSPTACTAVGSFFSSSTNTEVMLAERWNGASWSIQTTPNPAGARSSGFRGVSCASTTACTAVGFFVNSAGMTVTLTGRWNGASWTIQTSPNPVGATNSVLLGVSCKSTAACTAVGSFSNTKAQATLAERRKGASWSILTTPNPVGSTDSGLTGVACGPTPACTAVGSFVNSAGAGVPLAERYTPARRIPSIGPQKTPPRFPARS